jgi:hypothetical protein
MGGKLFLGQSVQPAWVLAQNLTRRRFGQIITSNEFIEITAEFLPWLLEGKSDSQSNCVLPRRKKP